VGHWTERSELPAKTLVGWIGIGQSKFHNWKGRYGKLNEHNAWVPREWWLEEWEKQAIVAFQRVFPLEGYRRLAFMMLDREVVAVSPTSVYRVLKAAGRIGSFAGKPSQKGKGFTQPLRPHAHWHIDITYLNIHGTFYYLCSIIDGYSRYIVHWEIRETMQEREVEVIVQRAREKFPGETPRIISDNGPQFIAKDFKEFIRLCGMTHVKTSPYYPQSNGKKERWYQTLKRECIRPCTPLSLEDARRVVAAYVGHYNQVRLHSALGYLAPADKLAGRAAEIFAARDTKLEAARARRKARRAVERPARIDFASLRRQVTIAQVLRHCGHLDALRGTGAQRRGPCPVHGPTHAGSRSFSVNLHKNVFRCFCPECGVKGNVLDLWSAIHQLPLHEAARHLAETFGLNLPSRTREEATRTSPTAPRTPLGGRSLRRDNRQHQPTTPILHQPLTQPTGNSNSR
jgi:transposase InsO family protein